MNNIESKYSSPADASKIITRVLYAYIVISIARVLLYTGFKIFSDDSLFVEGGFIYINADTLNMSSAVALIIYGLFTLIFLIVFSVFLSLTICNLLKTFLLLCSKKVNITKKLFESYWRKHKRSEGW